MESAERLTATQLAERLGVAKSTVSRWKDAGCPIAGWDGARPLYDGSQVEAWRAAQIDAVKAAAAGGLFASPAPAKGATLAAAQAAEKSAKAQIARLDLAERLREVVPSAEVAEAMLAEGRAVRDAVLEIAGEEARAAGLDEPAAARLDARIRERMNALADAAAQRAAAYRETEDGAAAAS